jgi:DNA-binding CsgD family transcriptional regulator
MVRRIEGENRSALSERERQVLELVVEGHTNREIAELFSLSVRTVETYRERLMRKLDIHTVAGLTRYAIGLGLVEILEK